MKWALCLACASIALGQPAFEVTSVKPSAPDQPGMGTRSYPARLQLENATLRFAIQFAFNVEDWQLDGGPKWIDTDHYDIEGKCAGTATDTQKLEMLQRLLADRFGLKFHREKREAAGYALVVGKNGPTLPKPDPSSGGFSTASGTFMVSGRNQTTATLARLLSRALTRPVADDTGLHERFDFKLDWSLKGDEPGPSVFALIQEQLGLRLEARRVPVEMLVIDGAEKPTAN